MVKNPKIGNYVLCNQRSHNPHWPGALLRIVQRDWGVTEAEKVGTGERGRFFDYELDALTPLEVAVIEARQKEANGPVA